MLSIVSTASKMCSGQLKRKDHIIALSTIALLLILPSVTPASAVVDYLDPEDFGKKSWSKTVDYLEYVDVYATVNGKPRPPPGAHAYLYMTYVNHLGVQMLYAGLSNITMGFGKLAVTLPIQTCMLHYKTENQKRDMVSASSYIMLMAYNETEQTTIHTGSPDRNDTLYASFSMGFDLSSLLSTDAPALNSKTKTIDLTHPEENRWNWGMTYTNLTALWWSVTIDPDNASHKSVPVAISIYEELTFTYDLIFNPENKTAKIESTYKIGAMTDLWVIDNWIWFIPIVVHYNNTGCYRLNHTIYSNENIHGFLERNGISMSMVFFQASAILDHLTNSNVNGQEVQGNEMIVINNIISTYSDEGERVSDLDFRSKNTYTLYNHTSGTRENYPVVPRLADRNGFARNPIFNLHTFLMRYIPLALAHMDKSLYEQAKNQLLNMTYADYFYILSYPTYDGYAIEHDPIQTIYFAPHTVPATPNFGGIIIIAAVALVAIVGTVALLKRRSKKTLYS